MLAALFLAACLSPPLFEMDGPVCSPARQDLECVCSECFSWDPVPNATRYDIYRLNQDGTFGWIGVITERPGYTDDDGNAIPAYFPPLWCVAKDARTPIEGRRYVYTVLPCNAVGCAAASPSVVYRGAPYQCYDHEQGGQVVCPHS
jgi:hypothetical protein